jgi:hypothetical protein
MFAFVVLLCKFFNLFKNNLAGILIGGGNKMATTRFSTKYQLEGYVDESFS